MFPSLNLDTRLLRNKRFPLTKLEKSQQNKIKLIIRLCTGSNGICSGNKNKRYIVESGLSGCCTLNDLYGIINSDCNILGKEISQNAFNQYNIYVRPSAAHFSLSSTGSLESQTLENVMSKLITKIYICC